MNLNELREVVKEVLQEQGYKWSDVLKIEPQRPMLAKSGPSEPKREPPVRDNVRGVKEFDTELEAREEKQSLFRSTDTARRSVYKTKEGKYFVDVVNDPKKGT